MGLIVSYDPCGTQKLEGKELFKRMALHLGVDQEALERALEEMVKEVLKNSELDTFRKLDKQTFYQEPHPKQVV